MNGRLKELCDSLEMGSEKKGRAQQVVYRAGNETDRHGRTGEVNSCSQPTCFPGSPSLWIIRVYLLELGAGRVVRKERSVGAPRDEGIGAGKASAGFL